MAFTDSLAGFRGKMLPIWNPQGVSHEVYSVVESAQDSSKRSVLQFFRCYSTMKRRIGISSQLVGLHYMHVC
jgi:hypothetical protein